MPVSSFYCGFFCLTIISDYSTVLGGVLSLNSNFLLGGEALLIPAHFIYVNLSLYRDGLTPYCLMLACPGALEHPLACQEGRRHGKETALP